jgi:hypothetical protein
MSTNDDSASRRGRRADQGAPDRRAPNRQDRDGRWDQSSSRERDAGDPYFDQGGRENQPPRGGSYSGFSRHSYAPPVPPRQEPAAPPPQQQRAFDPPPPAAPQNYYPEPIQRGEPARPYVEPAPAYAPPPGYEPDLPNLGYNDTGRDDLFARESAPSNYDPYGSQGGGYQNDPYDQHQQAARQSMAQPASGRREDPAYYQREAPPSPLDDYERSFAARVATQESQASRFFLPEEQPAQRLPQPERGYPPVTQPPTDRGYAPQQQYQAGGFNQNPETYGHDNYDPRYAPQESWGSDENAFHGDDIRGGLPQRVPHGDELDEDFFADEDELDHDGHAGSPRRGRKKLIAVALVGAIGLGGAGAYAYKMVKGGVESATPLIRADNRPSKEMPGNPGGRQFPNGEKAIYDRLTPDGPQTRTASFAPSGPITPAFAPAPATGNSLEDRIEEALKKTQRTGDAPPAPSGRPGADLPTVVQSERYGPDGRRIDAGRPMVTPNIVNVNGGQLPPPFGNAASPPMTAQMPAAAFRPTPVPGAPPAQQFSSAAPAAPRSAPARIASISPATEPAAAAAPPGFYVSLKSAPDEKAIQRDIPSLTDKYKGVLGDVQIISKIADLGAKGITFRAAAGPLGSQQEASELCQKIKGVGGEKACFVTK